MDIVYECCCGIDVHKSMIEVCLIKDGRREHQSYGTTTAELRKLSVWLSAEGCGMIAMESTASYWKPLYNIFEISGLCAIVVNAQHMKALPGRKTDVKDAEWTADLLRHGLLRASYIPERDQRELREISRYRKSLIEERARELNRLQKMPEGANIKLSGVLSDINGRSSRELLDYIISGEELNEAEVAGKLHSNVKTPLAEIAAAMDGITSPLQRRLMRSVPDHIDDMTRRIGDIDKIIKDYLTEYEDAIKMPDEIPGIGRAAAETILAETGLDMHRFPSAAHLCSWAGVAPGNNESAGKRKSGKTTKGNKTLKNMLNQCAKAITKSKNTFFYAQYQRLIVRRGKNRASSAAAHSMLIAIYHMLKNNVPYKELGADYYSQFNKDAKINAYIKKLSALGVTVSVAAAT